MSVLRDTLATVEPGSDERGDELSLDDGTPDGEDAEPQEDEPQDDPIHNDADAWTWVDSEVLVDPRPIVGPHIQHFSKGWFKKTALEFATPGQLFTAFLPCDYIEKEMIPAMNVLLQERRGVYVPLDFAEYMRWVSLWLARCCELTTKETFEDVEDPIPFNSRRGYSRYMSHRRFQDILACHTFRRGTPPDHEVGNRYWPIDSFWEAYNQNLAETVIPSWRLTIDESMNQWRGKKYDDGMPGVRNIPAKPHPVGQEYKRLPIPSPRLFSDSILLGTSMLHHRSLMIKARSLEACCV